MQTAAVALGSNLGNRLERLRAGVAAISALPGVRLLTISSILETPALVRPGEAPGPDYLNAVALLETSVEPGDLLAHLLKIELANGRSREREGKWGARTLDLDLLLMGQQVITLPGLVLPHARLHERSFVLAPLVQVLPGWVHPVRKESVLTMLARAAPPPQRR